jgi:non-specific serine/threonine protein kinase
LPPTGPIQEVHGVAENGWAGFGISHEIEGITPGEVADILASLVDKHLVVFDDQSGRFHMLESVLAYGRGMLLEQGEGVAYRARHREFYLQLVLNAEPHLRSFDQVEWMTILETDLDNLRAALRWSIDQGEADAALRFAVAVSGLWFTKPALNSEGQSSLAETLEMAGSRSITRSAAHLKLGLFSFWRGDLAKAAAEYRKSLRISRELGDEPGIAAALNGLGCVFVAEQGDCVDGCAAFDESLAIARRSGDLLTEASALSNLGEMALIRNDRDLSSSLYAQAVEIFRAQGDLLYLAYNLSLLGMLRLDAGDVSSARRHYEESVRLSLELGDTFQSALALSGLVAVLWRLGEFPRAAELQGYVLAEMDRLEIPLQRFDQEHLDRAVVALTSALGESEYELRVNKGRCLTLEQAMEIAAFHG